MAMRQVRAYLSSEEAAREAVRGKNLLFVECFPDF